MRVLGHSVRLLPSAIDQQTLGSRLAGPAGGGGSLAAKLRNLRCPPLADSQAVRFRMSPSVSAFRLQANFRFRPHCGPSRGSSTVKLSRSVEDGVEVHHHHKAKPWHGWREFAKELGTIVLAVIIALGAGQAAEWLHHRNEIREAREALHGELVVNASSLRTNLLEDQCLLSAMDYDERALKGETLPPRKLPNSVIFNYPVSTVWDAVRSGAVTRMGLDEKLAYARFYSRATRHQRAADRALDYLSHLRGYRETGTPTPAETRLILQYTGRAQTALTAKFQIEQQMLAEAKALGGRPVPISSVEQTMLQTECGSAGVPVGKID